MKKISNIHLGAVRMEIAISGTELDASDSINQLISAAKANDVEFIEIWYPKNIEVEGLERSLSMIMERRGGGRIVNITSDGIWHGYPDQLAYSASKGAVAVMTRCLARQLGPFNINVNAVAPGLTWSEATQASEYLQSTKDLAIARCALQREQFPEDLVGTVLFLYSPANDTVHVLQGRP